jgi:hypothetical protein
MKFVRRTSQILSRSLFVLRKRLIFHAWLFFEMQALDTLEDPLWINKVKDRLGDPSNG